MRRHWREVILFVFAIVSAAQDCQIPPVIPSAAVPCNQTANICVNATNITSLPGTVYNCSNSLQLTANYFNITGSFSGLMLTGANIQIQNVSVQSNFNINSKFMLNQLVHP